MPFDTKTFNSKIAFRIFLTFVACALIPVVCLSGVFYLQITRNLEVQNTKMLGHAVKSQAKTLFDRLSLAEQELDLVAGSGAPGPADLKDLNDRLHDRLHEKFKSIALVEGSGRVAPVLGVSPIKYLDLSADDLKHLVDRKALIAELDVSGSRPFIIVHYSDDAATRVGGFVAAEINPDFLWSLGEIDNLPPDTGFCVLDSSGDPFYSTEPELFDMADFLKAEAHSATSGVLEFRIAGEPYLASYSQVFLKPRYRLPHWTLILFAARSDVLKPIETFKEGFQWIILGTFLLVVWLSIAKIRKSMVPLGELIKGVDRIARKDFRQAIRVSSNDEFEVLAFSFNEMAHKLDQSFKALSEMSWGTLQALARTVDAKSAWTAGHSLRVTEWAVKVGGRLNLDSKSLEALRRASLLHDIGKVGVPSALLDKPSKLTDEESRIIQRHPALGAQIIEPIKPFREIIPMVAQHHERYDGRGYPYGYAADQIHWGARILAVVDVFDALASDRPYRRAMPIGQIFELMQAESGRQFDPDVVAGFLSLWHDQVSPSQEPIESVSKKVLAHG